VKAWLAGVTLAVTCTLAATLNSAQRSPSPQAVRPATTAAAEAAFLKQYCLGCHNDRAKAGNLSLDSLDPASAERHVEIWEKVLTKVRTGMMPPESAPKPPSTARASFAAALEAQLDRVALARPDPGSPALHRLNRAEYANAVRDLLAVDIDVTAMLPPDDSAAGFDNNADVLGVSPAHIEAYASAAAKISRIAVGDMSIGLDRVTYRAPSDLAQDVHLDGQPLGTRGGLIVRHQFPLDAEYDLEIGGAGGGGRLGAARGAPPRAGGPGGTDDRYVTIDGERITLAGRGATRLKVTAGPHTITAATAIRSRVTGVDTIFNAPTRTGGISQLTIVGPFNPAGPGKSPSRALVMTCTPTSPADETGCARTILNALASRAYRRPVPATGVEMDTLLEFYRVGRERGSFDSGIQRAVARVLVDPQFLFRFEREPANVAPGTPFRLTDVELASRLSFFLWSSIPDDMLMADAVRGVLKDPAVLEKQVRRMLADPKADALVSNFAGQWLMLRELRNSRPDSREWDGNLRQSFQKETEMLFQAVIREDRSILDLLDADFTFVDERLARHYGIPNVHGSRMRRVSLRPGDPRRGLLGHGSILTVTSAANRTSPVTRGKWVLENVLGAPPPAPPPGVETNLEENPAQVKATSLRQRMEAHRTNPACASCHRIMDPIGFSLENFDHTGKWRALDGATPIDASGVMVDGSRLDGPATLRQALLARSDVFADVFAERLLTYAVGRAMRPQDMAAVRAITRAGKPNAYRFSSFVLGVARSAPFQMKTKAE
jgi:mono/diheme cytochrome c family protein